jgi:hypothetical protein
MLQSICVLLSLSATFLAFSVLLALTADTRHHPRIVPNVEGQVGEAGASSYFLNNSVSLDTAAVEVARSASFVSPLLFVRPHTHHHNSDNSDVNENADRGDSGDASAGDFDSALVLPGLRYLDPGFLFRDFVLDFQVGRKV